MIQSSTLRSSLLVAAAALGAMASRRAAAAPGGAVPIASADVTAAEVADAPRPRDAGGIERPEAESAAGHLIWIPRVVLFLPRWAFWTVAQPIRLASWAYDEYQLGYLYKHGLINIDDTFGITPTASIGGGYGLAVGARVVHRDLLGDDERLRLRGSFGGRLSLGVGLELTSGNRFGDHFALELEAHYERRPHERFYGIGNAGLADPPPAPGMPIDPLTDPTAVRSRFREKISSAQLVADLKATSELSLRLSGTVMARDFGNDDTDPLSIERHYDTSRLVGYADGLEDVYLEAELRYDSRRRGSIYQSHALDATGWLASTYLGGMAGFRGDRSDYLRTGVELQRYFDLYRGSRVLALRVLAETVLGTNGGADGEISFVDLPQLGGRDDLRGYPEGRFRDRALTLASAEYTWDLGNYLAAFLFVDVGRTWHSQRDVELAGFHLGYGGGMQVQNRTSFVARAQLAASREGEVFFQLSLSPAFGRRERTGRF